ncbi:MAG: ATP-binding protein [Actinomycetota bacterium]|nr:ATP-binding protein [Actinomycetota bacterium]
MRIGKKLILSYALIATIVLLIAILSLGAFVKSFYINSLTHQLESQANTVRVAMNELEGWGLKDLNSPDARALINKLGSSMQSRITLIRKDGAVLADTNANPETMDNHASRPEVKAALAGKVGRSERFSANTRQVMLYVAVPYKTYDNQIKGVIRAAMPVSEINKSLNQIVGVMLIIVVLATIVMVIASGVLANPIVKPIRRMMKMVEGMANDDLEQRLPVNQNDEIGELSKSLNNLAANMRDKIEELKSEKAKAELILNSMAEGILLVNKSDEVVLTNPAIERIFKVKANDIIGRPVIHSIRSYDLDRAVHESLSLEKEVVDEIELQSPFRSLRLRVMPVVNSLGEKQALAVIRDITRQKQVERLRKDFIVNVSHELKTPLTGLKLLSDTLLRSIDTDPKSSKIFIKRLDKELSTLINMVRELIDLSKLESPQQTIEKEFVDLGEVVSEVGSSFTQLAAGKGLSLTVNIPESIPKILGDRDQLLTLTRNLVDNAIRYTPAGGKVDVKLEENNNSINLVVKDNGIGIAKREIPRIFERFYRVDKARSRETGGTGLGLSIVKHIAENHRATISVDSALGMGSTFTISFPIADTPPIKAMKE